MRSRYSAHVLAKADYLLATLSEDQRAEYDREDAEQSFADTKWLGLEIRKTNLGGEDDDTIYPYHGAPVEFVRDEIGRVRWCRIAGRITARM